jgi:DNA-binding SARP family transcriptional activator
LSAIVSKLRGLLTAAGLDGAAALKSGDGCYELQLPRDTWVDHEVAADSIHEAESALKAGEPARAYGPSAVAHHIARRPFLAGEEGHWFEQRREKLASILVRALECRAEVYLWNKEHSLAVEAARDAVQLRPFRETGYRLLMRAHAAAGNVAEALWVYERCRTLLSEELGVNPSPETQAVHLQLLKSL